MKGCLTAWQNIDLAAYAPPKIYPDSLVHAHQTTVVNHSLTSKRVTKAARGWTSPYCTHLESKALRTVQPHLTAPVLKPSPARTQPHARPCSAALRVRNCRNDTGTGRHIRPGGRSRPREAAEGYARGHFSLCRQ